MEKRVTISSLMFVVLVVAILLFLDGQRFHGKTLAFAILAFLLVFPYLMAPWITRKKHRIFLDPITESVELDNPDVPPVVSEYMTKAIKKLEEIGFRVRYIYRHTDLVPNSKSYALLMENKAGDVAKLIVPEHAGIIRIPSMAMVFTTEFEDGTLVVTSRTRSPRIYAESKPPMYGYRFPDVASPEHLYAIHRVLVGRVAQIGVRVDHLRGGVEAYQRRMREQHHQRQLALGYYRLDETGRVLIPTWKGAAMIGWRLVPPFKQIIAASIRRKARRLLRDMAPELARLNNAGPNRS